jgi:hypothetical protein
MMKRFIGRALPAVFDHQLVRKTHPTKNFQDRAERIVLGRAGFKGSTPNPEGPKINWGRVSKVAARLAAINFFQLGVI